MTTLRRFAHETKRDLIDVIAELTADDDSLLVRSVRERPRRVLMQPIPEPKDTYWMSHNGHLPKPSWCKTCGFPSAIGRRYVCPKHVKTPTTRARERRTRRGDGG
jgi:hypothetical protein